MRNKDFSAPWYDPKFDQPDAPHVRNKDDPSKAWNQIFWHPEQLTIEERQYYGIDFNYYKFKQNGQESNRVSKTD